MNTALTFWLLFYGIAALIWALRGLFAQKTLRAMPVIQNTKPNDSPSPEDFVSVIVPAKNEEENIIPCIESLIHQDYPHYEIIIVNDNSKDQTEEHVRSLGAIHAENLSDIDSRTIGRPKLLYLNCEPTPHGWTGKNFAIHSGMVQAQGKWLLFTDADTRHEASSISSAMQYLHQNHLQFLTLLPRCLAKGFFENLIQPCAMAFLGLWFPIDKINAPDSKTYFANGQFLLMERSLYEKIEGHANVREEFLEDFALMRKAKELGAKIHCASGVPIYGTRMYNSLKAIWKGWRRIYLHAFRRNAFLLFAKFLSVFLFSIVPFAALILLAQSAAETMQSTPLLTLEISLLSVLIVIICWKAYGIVKANRIYSFLHPLASIFIVGILLDATRMAIFRSKTTWR